MQTSKTVMESTNELASNERRNGRGRRGNTMLDHVDNPERPNTAESALHPHGSTTQAGRPRQRMTWSKEMNENVMRCYYKSTDMETINSGYASKLHELFCLIYPEISQIVTAQRLIDQKRVILKNKKLSDRKLQIIKEEVVNQRNNQNESLENNTEPLNNTTVNQSMNPDHNLNNNVSGDMETSMEDVRIPNQDETSILESIREHIIKWEGIDPANRPQLPKLSVNGNIKKSLEQTNCVINKHFTQSRTLEETNLIIYAAATTVLLLNKDLPGKNKIQTENSGAPRRPKWQIRIENRILELRKTIGRLTQYNIGNRTKKILKAITPILGKQSESPIELLDTLKQKLCVYSARLRRYKESRERKVQNSLFIKNQKRFYEKMESSETFRIIPPAISEIESFWKSIWSNPKTHNLNASWIEKECERNRTIEEQDEFSVTKNEISDIIQKTQSWKTPGPDQIHNFWYKQFTAIHGTLAKQITEILTQPNLVPDFLLGGRTYIIPKTSDTRDPANYRPITCLSTMYKIITSCLANKINKHLECNNILTEEQKGCRKKSQGCKEQIIIDTTILGQVNKKQRNLVTCYIDYKKAFDSIPHTWLIKTLEIYKVNRHIINFLATIMKSWRTTINLKCNHTLLTSSEIQIRRGIFQGDSLSALWFCLCLNPLSTILNETNKGFNIRDRSGIIHNITHLLYMDDIKLYAGSKANMNTLLKITEEFTRDTCMEFGISKCKMLHIQRGRTITPENLEIISNQEMENMQHDEVYKYLGIHQNRKIDHTKLKWDIRMKYKHRLTCILKSKLNSGNLFRAINSYAIPLLTYTFGILKWSQTDLEELNRLNRTLLTKFRYLHPNSSIERVNLKRNEGGRGLIDILQMHRKQVLNLIQYFGGKQTPLHKAIVASDEDYTPLNLKLTTTQTLCLPNNASELKEKWMQKQLHGQHYNLVANSRVDKDLTYAWLRDGYLFPETEGFIQAIQDQVIATKNYRKYIIKDNVGNDKCRRCLQASETIQHIVGGCTALAAIDYTERHNLAAKIVHQQLAIRCKLTIDDLPYYNYTPQTIMENEEFKLYWDRTILTDRPINCNRPDLALIDKGKSTTYLIDIAIPNDTNIHQKENEIITKYTPLAIELKDLWNQHDVQIIPIVMSATGITAGNFIAYLEKIGVNSMIHRKIQRAVLLKTANIVRKFLNVHL